MLTPRTVTSLKASYGLAVVGHLRHFSALHHLLINNAVMSFMLNSQLSACRMSVEQYVVKLDGVAAMVNVLGQTDKVRMLLSHQHAKVAIPTGIMLQ
jgi:hypothetical protein